MSRMDIARQTDHEDALGLPSPQRNHGAGGAGLPLPQKNLLLVVWRGRWIVLLCAALALGGGFFYLSNQTPIYSSSSRILVEPEGPRIISADIGTRSQTGNYLATQCELIQSAQILASVAELPELHSMKSFADVDNPIGLLRADLSATTGQKDDLITVSFESAFREEAASIVNAVVDSYKAYHASRKRSTAAEVLRVLTKEKRERDAELHEKTKAMLAFKQANPNLSYAGEKGNIIIDQLAKLSDALTTARLELLEAKAIYEGSRAMASDPARMEQWLKLQQQGGAGGGGLLLAEVQRLELELAALRQTQLPEHANVRSVESRLDDLRQRSATQARESFEAYLSALEQRWGAARQREAELQQSYAQQQQAALALNTQSTEFGMMASEAARLERLCDLLDSRIKEVRITESADPMNLTVLEQARADGLPIRPKRGTILFQALVLGLLAGCGLAYLRDLADQRLAGVDEIQALLGLNVLGALPHMSGNETAAVRGQKVQLDPMSDIAEAYRTIRTAIYFGAPEGRAKRILVTSPAPGDGKTTSASNLAIAMAQAGQRVLLIDCDFRKPMQHRIFGVEDGIGLTNVVAGQTPLGKAIKRTATKGLYLLPSGPVPQNPSEILNGHTFAQVLARLGEKFDHLVIDSPPIMPVTDARILGASCDVTILVLRAQKSTRRLSQHACESMLSVGSRILGVIVNDVPRRKDGYGYRYYSYGYGGNGQAITSPAGRTNGAKLPTAAAADGKLNSNGNRAHAQR